MSMISTIDCIDHPMIFFLKNGDLFKAHSFKNKRQFKTEFFLITEINEAKNCITLMLLRPCSLCCDKNVFISLDECITIDMSCLCGYQSIPNACISKCEHPPVQMEDCICGQFSILSGHDEAILWQSNVTADQYGTIKICLKNGGNTPLKLRIYYNDSRECKTYSIVDETLYTFSVSDFSLIKIIKPNLKTKVQGTFEINFKHHLITWN